MRIYSIGFTQSTACDFFSRLRTANIAQLIDVRLHRTSQLSGFAKEADLPFLLAEIGKISYRAEPLFAPTQELLESYKLSKAMAWEEYARRFTALLESRRVEECIPRYGASLLGALTGTMPSAPRHRLPSAGVG